MASCFLCFGASVYLIVDTCVKKNRLFMDTIDGSLDERSTTPGYCTGNGLSTSALTILPSCLKPALQMSCEDIAIGAA